MKYWAGPGFGSTIALTAAALSEKMKILFVSSGISDVDLFYLILSYFT